MAKILILFASKSMRNSLCKRLRFENFTTYDADNIEQAELLCSTTQLDAAIVEYGFDIERVALPTIIVTATPNIDTAIDALRHGAIDYLTTPLDMNRLLETLRHFDSDADNDSDNSRHSYPYKLRHSSRRNCSNSNTQPIIGNSAGIEHVRDMIRRVAPSDARVMVLGENGTGKGATCSAREQDNTRGW